MNKAELNILAGQPEMLDKARLNDMKALVKDFSYFQGAHILLLKNLHNIHHYEFDATLKKTALSIPNRVHLYHFLHNITEDTTPIYKKRTTESVNPEKEELKTIITELENKKETDFTISHSEVELLTESEFQQDKQIIEKSEIIYAQPTFEQKIDKNTNELHSDVVSLENQPLESKQSTTEELHPISNDNEEHSFIEWLKMSKGIALEKEETSAHLNSTENTTNNVTEVLAKMETPVNQLNESVLPPEPKPANNASNIVVVESLLDKFLRENPRMSRPKAEFYNPSNMAKQSVEEDDEIATETLAKIYLKQGHHKKAIRIYEKLCLLYPHRIAYFADLIQKIKQDNKD
jgi:hypothetical protein